MVYSWNRCALHRKGALGMVKCSRGNCRLSIFRCPTIAEIYFRIFWALRRPDPSKILILEPDPSCSGPDALYFGSLAGY